MIGNRFLRDLYELLDEDTSLNQLLEFLVSKDKKFLDSLNKSINLDGCNDDEIRYLTIAAAVIDYQLQLNGTKIPDWIRNRKLIFDKPYYHSKRLSDFDKVKLQYTNPAPFRNRNVYFELEGIKRV